MTTPTVYKSIELASGGRVSLTVQMDWLKADAGDVQFCRLLAGALDDYEKEAAKRAARDAPPAPELPPVETFEPDGFTLADCPVEGCEWAGTLDGLRQHLSARPHRLTGAAKRVKARRDELVALAAERRENPALPQVPLWEPEPGSEEAAEAFVQAQAAADAREAGEPLRGATEVPLRAEAPPRTEVAHMDDAAPATAPITAPPLPTAAAIEPGKLTCTLESDDGDRCGFEADDAEQMDRHLRRRHSLYGGDDPDDVEYRAEAVRAAQAAAGLPAEWGL